jgi:hypothetical protein
MIRQLSLRTGAFLPIIEAKGGAAMTKLFALVGVAGALFVAGCMPAPLTKSDVDGAQVCHEEKMDQVERAALRGNRMVKWVNCPLATLRVT